MRILVRTLTGRTTTILSPLDASVSDLRVLIQDKDGVPLSDQRIIFAGNQLEDGRSLKDYRIEDDTVLWCIWLSAWLVVTEQELDLPAVACQVQIAC